MIKIFFLSIIISFYSISAQENEELQRKLLALVDQYDSHGHVHEEQSENTKSDYYKEFESKLLAVVSRDYVNSQDYKADTNQNEHDKDNHASTIIKKQFNGKIANARHRARKAAFIKVVFNHCYKHEYDNIRALEDTMPTTPVDEEKTNKIRCKSRRLKVAYAKEFLQKRFSELPRSLRSQINEEIEKEALGLFNQYCYRIGLNPCSMNEDL